jgi:hypothetical protein
MEKNIVILRESDRGESGGRSGQIWGAGGGQLGTHGSMLGSAGGPIRKGVAIGLDGKWAAAKPTIHVDTGLLGPFIWPRAHWANLRSHLYINVHIFYIYIHIYNLIYFWYSPIMPGFPSRERGTKVYIYIYIYSYMFMYILIWALIYFGPRLFGSLIWARAHWAHSFGPGPMGHIGPCY